MRHKDLLAKSLSSHNSCALCNASNVHDPIDFYMTNYYSDSMRSELFYNCYICKTYITITFDTFDKLLETQIILDKTKLTVFHQLNKSVLYEYVTVPLHRNSISIYWREKQTIHSAADLDLMDLKSLKEQIEILIILS